MKKFNVSENLVVATSRKFKETIDFAVSNTEKKHNFTNKSHGANFIGTVVTFNPSNGELECFGHYDYIDYTNDKSVQKSLQQKLTAIIENNTEYKLNEFVTFVRASDFHYHGYVGYDTKEQQEINAMKLEHKAMSIYIDVITDKPVVVNEDVSIESLALSARTYNCLKRADINTVDELKSLTYDEICKVRNLGMNSLTEIETKLAIKFI